MVFRFHWIFICSLLLVLAGCSTASYEFRQTSTAKFESRAKTETLDQVTVSAAVPSAEEAEELFGFPVYDRGIQPIWLTITNASPERVRFVPTSVDKDYFSPLEVSFIFRKGFSKEARREIDQRLYRLGIPRIIPAGSTVSGYVFTNVSTGTKSFNVDIFGVNTDMRQFAFFLPVPGFVPDHSRVEFKKLYDPSERIEVSSDDFKQALAALPYSSSDFSGEKRGLPISLVIAGSGDKLLRSLLRAGWVESALNDNTIDPESAQHYFGRVPDAIFRNHREGNNVRNELRVWLSPILVDGVQVWFAQVTQFIGRQTGIEQRLFGALFDPDMDSGRSYLVQNFWYSQSLEQIAWLKVVEPTTFNAPLVDFNGTEYFSDGRWTVIWLAEKPVSLTEVSIVEWDEHPVR